jgi:hypothetical protein
MRPKNTAWVIAIIVTALLIVTAIGSALTDGNEFTT